jgi:cell division protein FtsB
MEIFTEKNKDLLDAILKQNAENAILKADIAMVAHEIHDMHRNILKEKISAELQHIAVFFKEASAANIDCYMQFSCPSIVNSGISIYADTNHFDVCIYIDVPNEKLKDLKDLDTENVFGFYRSSIGGEWFAKYIEDEAAGDFKSERVRDMYYAVMDRFTEDWETIKGQIVGEILLRLETRKAELSNEVSKNNNTLEQLQEKKAAYTRRYDYLKKEKSKGDYEK